jgi:glutamate dehydrogenase
VSVTSRGSRRLEEARDELISRVEKSISKDLTSVVSRYFDLVAPEDLVGTDVRDLEGLIKSHVALGQSRTPGTSKVQALSPNLDSQGWQSPHSVVQVVTDDMPFLVDSVSAEISQQDRSIRVVIHPRFWVKRDQQGELIEILDLDVLPGESIPEGAIQESWISVEIDRESETADLKTIETRMLNVLGDVRATVEDWAGMQAKLVEVISEIETAVGVTDRERREAIEFLNWLTENHFTFVGYSNYDLSKNVLSRVPASGLGTLRSSNDGSLLSLNDQDHSSMSSLMVVTKARMRSTVHRPVFLDYVGIRRVDASGNQIGEHRFLGLFSSAAYNQSVTNIQYFLAR